MRGRVSLRSRRALCASALLVATVIAPPASGAEPTAAEKETARSLMDDGYARRDKGDHAGALRSFEGADALMHVPTTGLEAAREQAALGHVVEARDALVRVLRAPATSDEPEPFRVARTAARALDAQLATRVAGLRVSLRRASSASSEGAATLTIDGVTTPPAALAAPFRVNPGHHVLVAQSPSGAARQEIDVAEGETKSVTLVLEASAPPRRAAIESSSGVVPALRWGGFGLAAVGVTVGTIAGVLSLTSTSAARAGCVADKCPPSTWSDLDSAHTTATVATIAFVAAGVGAATGVVSFFVGTPSATPWIGLGQAGLRGTF